MNDDLISRAEAIEAVHKTMFDFFNACEDDDVCEDDEEVPFTEKDKFLLEVNKAISNSIKSLPTAEPDIARAIATILENEQDMRVIKRNAEPRWIPVVDKLPNEDEIIYNSVGVEGERDLSDRVLAIDSTGFVRCGYFMKSCSKHEYHGNGKRNKYSDYGKASWEFGEHYDSKPKNWIVAVAADIVAWMPAPWKGESDEDNN